MWCVPCFGFIYWLTLKAVKIEYFWGILKPMCFHVRWPQHWSGRFLHFKLFRKVFVEALLCTGPSSLKKILQTLLFILRVGCMEHLVGHSCTKQAYSLHTNTHPWGFWLSGPNALLGVEIWVREMWKWLSLSSFETLHLSLTAVSGGCAFTQAGDLSRSSQKKVTRAKESRQLPLPPGGQGFHPLHHPQVSSFSSAFS